MTKDLFKYSLLILVLPFLQVSIFNNVDLLGYIDPYFYIIFIFVFPFYKDKKNILFASFLLGLFIDMLTNDGGIHTFSLVFLAYSRVFFLEVITGKRAREIADLKLDDFIPSKLFLWVISLSFLHHFIVFFLEQFSFSNFGRLLLKTFIASTFSIIVISFALQIFIKKGKNA